MVSGSEVAVNSFEVMVSGSEVLVSSSVGERL